MLLLLANLSGGKIAAAHKNDYKTVTFATVFLLRNKSSKVRFIKPVKKILQVGSSSEFPLHNSLPSHRDKSSDG